MDRTFGTRRSIRRTITRVLPSFAVFLAVLLAGPLAGADERSERTERARVAYESGLAHYNLDEFEAAIVDFENAYRLKPDPILLFNIAQAARLGKKLEMAVAFYEKYLRHSPRAPNAAQVRERMAELRKLIRDENVSTQANPQNTLPPGTAEPSMAARQVRGATPPAATASVTKPPLPAQAAPPAPRAAITPAIPVERPAKTGFPATNTPPAAGMALRPPATGVLAAPAPAPILAAAPTATARSHQTERRSSAARKWWVWTLVGGSLVAGGGVALGLTLSGDHTSVPTADYGPVSLGLTQGWGGIGR